MSLKRASKHKVCKYCRDDIWTNVLYYPQRRKQALCIDCGKPSDDNSFMGWLLDKLK